MFIRFFSSVMIVTSAFTIIFGQTPEAKKEKAQAFAFSFEGAGGYLGVQTQEVNKENFAKFGLRDIRGVAVEKVMENSPAAAAGIQAGDVIIRFAGEDVTSARKLTRLVSEVAPDHQVKITIARRGGEQEITATVGKRPMPKFDNGNFTFKMPDRLERFELERLGPIPPVDDVPKGDMPRIFSFPRGSEGQSFTWRSGEGRQIGISVYPVTKQLGERFGVESGVMINNVREDSPAAKAGLKAGDIIVEVDNKSVKNNLDVIRSINEKKDGSLSVTIVRDRSRQTIVITPEVSKDSGFVFQTDGEDGLMPPSPMTPMVPPGPMTPPAPMTLLRPERVL